MCLFVGAPVARLASSSVQMFVILPVKLLDFTMKSVSLPRFAAMKDGVSSVEVPQSDYSFAPVNICHEFRTFQHLEEFRNAFFSPQSPILITNQEPSFVPFQKPPYSVYAFDCSDISTSCVTFRLFSLRNAHSLFCCSLVS